MFRVVVEHFVRRTPDAEVWTEDEALSRDFATLAEARAYEREAKAAAGSGAAAYAEEGEYRRGKWCRYD